MMYRLDMSGKNADIWYNFRNANPGGPEDPLVNVDNLNDDEYDELFTEWVNKALKPHNGYDVSCTTFIDFETEEDAVAFKLRFL